MTNCESCTHTSTCKYKNDFEIFIKEQTECQEQLRKQKIKNTVPDFISVDYRCIYFCPALEYYYRQPDSWPDHTNTTTVTLNSSDSCNDCDFYNNYTKLGKIYIGDSPCWFCPKNKFNITYSK